MPEVWQGSAAETLKNYRLGMRVYMKFGVLCGGRVGVERIWRDGWMMGGWPQMGDLE